ncbi:MAG TPA: hypothetical protein VMT69_01100 [Kineosporiaceae bacterium]|nr:hypothetical protein [Kineosporiaceae bacterium]
MHGTTRTRTPATPARTGLNAVVWVGPGRALVLRGDAAGATDEAELALPAELAATPAALAEVAHRVGRVDRVLVLGTDDLRTALEREIVAIGHAPETIREAELEGPVDRDALRARLRRLA